MASRSILFAVLGIFYLSGVQSGVVTKCKTEDSKCAKESAQAMIKPFSAGLSQYNVEVLDPVTFKKVDASSPNLKLILTDVIVKGLGDCVMKKVKRDKPKNKLFLKLLCSCELDGQYEMKGRLLILPIEGKGPLHVTLRKAEISVDVDIVDKDKGGKTYWDVTGWKYTYELKDKSDVVFGNLFEGNEALAKAAGEMIQQNGNEVILEVGGEMMKAAVNKVITNVKNFFKALPAEELALD